MHVPRWHICYINNWIESDNLLSYQNCFVNASNLSVQTSFGICLWFGIASARRSYYKHTHRYHTHFGKMVEVNSSTNYYCSGTKIRYDVGRQHLYHVVISILIELKLFRWWKILGTVEVCLCCQKFRSNFTSHKYIFYPESIIGIDIVKDSKEYSDFWCVRKLAVLQYWICLCATTEADTDNSYIILWLLANLRATSLLFDALCCKKYSYV